MTHFTDDDLAAQYFGDVSADQRQSFDAHRADCSECRARLDELTRMLDAVKAADAPPRDDEYGTEVWRRIRPAIAALPLASSSPAAPVRGRVLLFAPRRLAWVGAIAAMLVAAFVAGRLWPRATPASVPQGAGVVAAAASPSVAEVRERILLVAVGDHLDQSQTVLVELTNAASGGPLDVSTERERAEDLVSTNRLYRQVAANAGDTATASLLDELERLLVEIAHGPSELSVTALDDLRSRIEAQGILFKLRVVGSRVREKTTPRQPASS